MRSAPLLCVGVRHLALTLSLVLLLAASFAGLAPAARAQSAEAAAGAGVVLQEESIWNYAELLLRQREYYRAVSEYKRLLYYFPKTPLANAASIRIGEAQLLGGEARQAIDHFTALLAEPLPPRMDGTVLYLRGMSWLDLEAERPYSLREPNILAGLADLRAAGPDLPYAEQVRGLLNDMDSPRALPEKSALLAGSLSAVVPGLGSVYVGNYSEAALALFANTLLAYATITAFEEEQLALAAFFGTFTLAFYTGNIYAAANGAIRHNEQVNAEYLAERRAAWGIVPREQGLSASLLISF